MFNRVPLKYTAHIIYYIMGFFDALLSPVLAGIQKHNQMDLNEQANRFDIQKMSFQNKLNRQNSLDAPLLNKLGLQSAGLNVNSQFGFSPVAGSSVSSSSGGSASMPVTSTDIGSFAQAMSQLGVNKAVQRKTEADAEKQELENLATKEENKWYDFAVTPLPEPEFDKDGNLVIADIPVYGHKTKRGAIAMETAKKTIDKINSELDFQISQADLQSMINNKQLRDDDVMQALVKMPKASYDALMEQINELVTRQFMQTAQGKLALSASALNVLEREMSNNAIINDVVEDIDKGDVSVKKIVKGIIKASLKKFLGDKKSD